MKCVCGRCSGTKHTYAMAVYISPQEMLDAFESNKSGGKRLLITAAVSAGKGTIDAGYEIAEIGKYVEGSSTVGVLN